MPITHDQQRILWNKEHEHPFAITQMDSEEGSSCLLPFYEFLAAEQQGNLTGIEMGCGKGRNVLWMARQTQIEKMYGFDFSDIAITEANRRATTSGLEQKTDFRVMDAMQPWEYTSNSVDFAIDCTASTDIEDRAGREFAVQEMHRVVKSSGFVLVYVMSTDDEYHKMIIAQSPADEAHAFIHPLTGKFEKVFSGEELDVLYKNFTLRQQRRIEKTAHFFGTSYKCKHHWRVYQK